MHLWTREREEKILKVDEGEHEKVLFFLLLLRQHRHHQHLAEWKKNLDLPV